MTYFNLRPFLSDSEVSIYNGDIIFKCSLSDFTEIESNFLLPKGCTQIEYSPNSTHITVIDGVQVLNNLNWGSGNTYISKAPLYKKLYEEYVITNAPKPPSLKDAKDKVKADIYKYADNLIEGLVNSYASLEQDTWLTVTLKEATDYLESKDPAKAPNLYIQEKIRLNIIGKDTPDLLKSLESRCTRLADKASYLKDRLNTAIGIRGRHTDTVDAFTQNPKESELEAIDRLLLLDWSTGWPT